MDGRKTRWILAACAIAWVAIVFRGAMNTKGPEDFVITVTQPEVQTFAREQLDQLQAASFAENTEYCGFIFEDSNGDLNASSTIKGHEDSCDISFFDMPGMAPVASFHTHGGYSVEFDSEVPSLIDMQSDVAAGIDGYIATPGGRFWWIDWREQQATQVCGAGCLTQDSAYRPCRGNPPAEEYSYETLQQRSQQSFTAC